MADPENKTDTQYPKPQITEYGDVIQIDSWPCLQDGKWHHICLVHIANGPTKYYVDGVLQ